jgi:predicted MPP superfamily phosphohydrolase
MDTTFAVTVQSALIGLAALVALVVLVRMAPGRIGSRHVVYPVAALTVGSLVGAGVLYVDAEYSPFFPQAHLGYLVLVLAVPALGLGLLVASLVRGTSLAVWLVAAAMLVPAPMGWYATHVAPNRLRVDRGVVELPAARSGRQPIRVGIMSDLQTNHIGEHEERAVRMLMAERPDVILIAGDFFQGDLGQLARELPAFRRLLARLRAPGGVFAVRGDVDSGDALDRLVVGTRIRILDDELVTRRIRDRMVAIVGNRLLWAPDVARAPRDQLFGQPPGTIRILLAHRPDVAFALHRSGDADLTVAGHTHGGQVALPIIGPPVTFSQVPRRVGRGGLSRWRNNWVYVSPGIGLERNQAPQVRFLTTPSVGLVTLR